MEPRGGTANRITVLHDAFGSRPGLIKDWGFAALVEFEGQRILFDTGNDSRTFAANTGALGVDLRTIDLVVVSHRHGDHTSGLDHLLHVNPDVPVYAPAELYGVFGSSLPGHFYPRRPSLPRSMQYYDGEPPDVIRHGTPWPGARFTWIEESTPLGSGAWLIPVVSEVAGTRELREISLALLTSQGLVLVVGCSHPGIERILEAAAAIDDRVHCIAGGLHLVLAEEPEVRRVAQALRDEWQVQTVAPGHCTGEPAFLALSEAFGNRYLYAGLGDSVPVP